MRVIQTLISSLKDNFGLYISISFGIFLFVLFFQPYQLTRFDLNNTLIFSGGLAFITYIWLVAFHIVVPSFIKREFKEKEEFIPFSLALSFGLFIMGTLSYIFYLRYVGFVDVSFHMILKTALICLVPPVIIRYSLSYKNLRVKYVQLIKNNPNPGNKISLPFTIELSSVNSSEIMPFLPSDIIVLKSAGNYVEVNYLENSNPKMTLVRNTLKNIENQLYSYPNFIRCHRTTVVNIDYVKYMFRKNGNYWLSLHSFKDPIAVSRQYIFQFNEQV